MISNLHKSGTSRILETDEEIVAVIDKIYTYYAETSLIVGPIGNMFTVFFHDLVIHFSGILIQRVSSGSNVDVPIFPYVDKRYSISPYRVDLHMSLESVVREPFKDWLREIQIIPLAIGNSLPHGYKQQWLTSKLVSLLGAFQRPVKSFLPKQRQQIEILLACIGELCSVHEIPAVGILQDNWKRYAEAHTIGEQTALNQHTVVLGNRQDLQNRKLAVNFLQQDKDVVAFTHGEIASTVFDEPMYGYAERNLCSTLVEYGKRNIEEPNNKVLVRPKVILYRNSSVAQTRYRRSERIETKDLNQSKVLYIPTTYVGNQIYGPFHAYEDLVYRKWHSALVEAIPSLTVKVHPKSSVELQPPGQLERRWLDDCIDEYDVLIIDYVATSAVLSIVSDKPVIYFDIGLRRLSKEFEHDLHARCQYERIDIKGNLQEQIHDCLEKYTGANRSWSNIAIEKYIINNDEKFSWFELIHKATFPD